MDSLGGVLVLPESLVVRISRVTRTLGGPRLQAPCTANGAETWGGLSVAPAFQMRSGSFAIVRVG